MNRFLIFSRNFRKTKIQYYGFIYCILLRLVATTGERSEPTIVHKINTQSYENISLKLFEKSILREL